MQPVYIVWLVLPVLFVVAALVMRARDNRAAERDESGIDPMFQPDRATGRAAGRRR